MLVLFPDSTMRYRFQDLTNACLFFHWICQLKIYCWFVYLLVHPFKHIPCFFFVECIHNFSIHYTYTNVFTHINFFLVCSLSVDFIFIFLISYFVLFPFPCNNGGVMVADINIYIYINQWSVFRIWSLICLGWKSVRSTVRRFKRGYFKAFMCKRNKKFGL